MGFWSGFEGLTGHQPGAFKGFSLKDIIDDDLWKRHERLGGRQSRQFEETGVVPTTAWYKGMGRPEMMGPRVGAAGVTPVDPAAIARRRAGGYAGPPVMEQVTSRNRLDRTMPHTQNVPAVAHVSAARPWANIQAQMLGDPRQGAHGQADRTTTIKKFADPNKSDEETTVIKDKIQGGPAYNRPPPNWMMRTGLAGEGYFGRPTTFSSPTRPEGALASSAQPTSIMNMFNMQAWQDLARRKWEERMRAKRGY